MTTGTLQDYFAALERLKQGRPNTVPKGMRITNDAVALEAGRGKGSIKKSRPIFYALIQAIDEAATAQSHPKYVEKERLRKGKESAEQCRRDLEAALAREVSLLREVYALKKQLSKLTGGKVLPLRGTAPAADTR